MQPSDKFVLYITQRAQKNLGKFIPGTKGRLLTRIEVGAYRNGELKSVTLYYDTNNELFLKADFERLLSILSLYVLHNEILLLEKLEERVLAIHLDIQRVSFIYDKMSDENLHFLARARFRRVVFKSRRECLKFLSEVDFFEELKSLTHQIAELRLPSARVLATGGQGLGSGAMRALSTKYPSGKLDHDDQEDTKRKILARDTGAIDAVDTVKIEENAQKKITEKLKNL
jgi:hypothetical protein